LAAIAAAGALLSMPFPANIYAVMLALVVIGSGRQDEASHGQSDEDRQADER
jgi:hypothetical protein